MLVNACTCRSQKHRLSGTACSELPAFDICCEIMTLLSDYSFHYLFQTLGTDQAQQLVQNCCVCLPG